MTGPQHDPWHAPDEPGYNSAQLETFMRTFNYALGLADAGDADAGQRLLQNHLEELRHSLDSTPAALLDLWEIGLVRYEDQFRAPRSHTAKSPEGG